MISRNPHFANLSESYLFQEIEKRVAAFRKNNQGAKIYNLGIGDTTIPLPLEVTKPLAEYALQLSTEAGYTGYQKEQGSYLLRELISKKLYASSIDPEEIFISDGAKSDIGRLQQLLSHLSPVLIQDPTYPVYRDGTILIGKQKIIYAQCLPEHDFFPIFSGTPRLIYLCSPNNPTGTAFTYPQLTKLVEYAHKNAAVIIYDAAYRAFIEGQEHPRSIFEIPGAEKVAIEVNSFSKFAGFTGIRLGFSIVRKEIGALYTDFMRLHSTIFNGASILAQKAGEFLLQDGMEAAKEAIKAYKENTLMMKAQVESLGYTTFGGIHAPYLWVQVPQATSWDLFSSFLSDAQLLVTPGSGFGPSGEGFVRLSGLFHPSLRSSLNERLQSLSLSIL